MEKQLTVLGRDEAIKLLIGCKSGIQEKYGITAIGLFGSLARNQATATSDVDVVVQLLNPDLFTLVHIKEELEAAFHRHVDILQYREKMNPYLKRHIEQEAVYV
jgi:predicted nucleotidyltransferase